MQEDRDLETEDRVMKVLHLIDSGGLYGAEQMLLGLCREQLRQGLTPVILSCGLPGEMEKPLEIAARGRGIAIRAWRMRAGLNLGGMRDILEWARKQNFQILHSHGYKFNILLALCMPRHAAIPTVATIHGYVQARFPSRMWLYEWLDRRLITRLDRIVVVSEAALEQPGFRHIPDHRIQVIRNGISPLARGRLRRHYARPAKKLVAIGRLSVEKGFDVLIEAMAQLDETFSLTIFGEGGRRQALIEQARGLGVADRITFAGYVPNACERLAEFDALIMPSRTEGIPITLLEAIRARVPVIATRVGGIPEVLGESSVFLCKSVTAQAICEALARWNAMESAFRRRHMEGLYKRFKNLFQEKAMADRYLSIYSEELSTPASVSSYQ
jgi:glycosyltransferase involved in cell wall biosynthesis